MENPALFRMIPAVDEVLRRPEVAALAAEAGPALLAAWTREALDGTRRRVMAGKADESSLREEIQDLPRLLREKLERMSLGSLRRVINATGVLIHTNLGRAPLPDAALAAMHHAGSTYTNLEYDLVKGERGSRGAHLRDSAEALFPGHALIAVNNNAAAVLLVLNTLAEGREVIVSRGELVEIGGSFRIPEVMEKAGATLREVGTTNRTRLSDYASAISERTGLLVKVHTSNYRIVGFVEETPLQDLVRLGRERHLPVVVDQGSGSLLAGQDNPIPDEPHVLGLLTEGASLVTFSGDKLLGGPQAGLIVGEKDLVARCARNPLARALRLDKARIAALASTLAEHASGRAGQSIPVLRMLNLSTMAIETRARAVLAHLDQTGAALTAGVEDGHSKVGGGSAPMHDLPTRLLVLRPTGRSAASYAEVLRRETPPVIVRIADDRVLVDLRTVDPQDDPTLTAALQRAAG